MAEFGEMLSELRQDRNLSQKDMAKLLNVSSGTISNYETGRHAPSLETVVQLANYFNVTTDYLLGRTDSSLSVKWLEEDFVHGKTIGDMVRLLKSLHGRNRCLAYEVLEVIRLSDAVLMNNMGEK